MKNKKLIVLIIIILIIAIAVGYKMRMKDEKRVTEKYYDMKITYHHVELATGYGTEYDFDLIDLKNKKAYIVHDYEIWGNEKNPLKKGHNYKIKTIKLTENDVENLKELIDLESNDSLKGAYSKEYTVIEYQDKTIYRDDISIQYDNK